jgi:hypothetical protein
VSDSQSHREGLPDRHSFSLTCFYGALCEVDGLLTSGARVGFVEFVRENFILFAAVGAFAQERLEHFVRLKTWTMHRCGHRSFLLVRISQLKASDFVIDVTIIPHPFARN